MMPRCATLMTRLLATEEVSRAQLASELAVPEAPLDSYLTGGTLMPLTRQLVLARFVVARSTALRSAGNALLAQVIAATGYHAKRTATHAEPPTTWSRRKR